MDLDSFHKQYIQEAITLANKGLGSTAPNPMVGCVLVKNNEIIGSGYTQPYGGSHAEVVAIESVKNPIDLKESTLYVTLEPCSHFGKTPPCADLIVASKIPRVVVSCIDPFSKVNGQGIQKLIKAGIDVTIGIMETEAKWQNRRFFTFHEQKRPYIILKWAQTMDGFISKFPVPKNRLENLISGPEVNTLVHQWRSEEQAILVGSGTMKADDPLLNVRLVEGKNPMRLIVDSRNELNLSFKIFNDHSAQTVVFNNRNNEALKDIVQIQFKDRDFVKSLNTYCYKNNIQSVLIEGGRSIHQYFIDNQLWDEIRLIKSPKHFHQGIKAPLFEYTKLKEQYAIGADEITIYFK
jgi:diaminohydroxyphosphoribosylaminopyrimidine deaminase / 5-amino-6-(5-phosphoribosylamino)uracil reductase